MSKNRAVIVANGEIQDLATARTLIDSDTCLVAADGGSRHCRVLGLTPQVLIGDLDSTSPADLAALEAAGTRIIWHPTHKDKTDLELALLWVLEQGIQDIVVLAALGGRWDQTLANLLLPTLPAFQNARIRLIDGKQQIAAVRGPGTLTLTGQPGDTVSLIPVGGAAIGVTLTGLEYPLTNATIQLGSTLGISNVMLTDTASVELREGRLICTTIGKE